MLDGWYTPEGLAALLAQDVGAAEKALRESPSDYLPLRGYQHQAIRSVGAALEQGQRSALLAMATGTGKARTLIGPDYPIERLRW